MSIELFSGLPPEDLLMELGSRMARVEEEATSCSWHDSVKESLPAVCYEIVERGQGGLFKAEWVSLLEARLLVSLATRLGHWVDVGKSERWERYVPEAMIARKSHWIQTAAPTGG